MLLKNDGRGMPVRQALARQAWVGEEGAEEDWDLERPFNVLEEVGYGGKYGVKDP